MNIGSKKRWIVLGLAAGSLLLALPLAAQTHGGGHGGGAHASARHGGGHGGAGWHGGGAWHGGGPGWWGLGLGLGLGWGVSTLYAPYPGYYYDPDGAPVVIVDPQTSTPTVPPPAQSWYYCDSAGAYYPYVSQCPEPWRMVPAVPPGPTR